MRAILWAVAILVVASASRADEPARAQPTQETQGADDGRQGYRIAGWIAAGATIAVAGSAVYFHLKVQDLEDEAGANVRMRGLSGDACDFDFNQQICHEGERSARYGNVFLLAAVPVAVAAGYLLYKGYSAPPVTPVVGAGTVGAAATIRF